MLTHLTEAVMQACAAAFAGICCYIALAQHPVRMASTPRAALEDFRSVIPRAERIQAPLLVVALVAVVLHVLPTPSWPVAAGGLLLLAVLVQTLVAVLPINRRLLGGDLQDHLASSEAALTRWGRLHATRTVAAVVGAVLLWF